MKRIILILTVALLAVPLRAQYCEDAPTWEDVIMAYLHIPDHCRVSEEAQEYMTPRLYNILGLAWDAPEVSNFIGNIGDNEFLLYFVSGNGDTPDLSESDYKISLEDARKDAYGDWYVDMIVCNEYISRGFEMTFKKGEDGRLLLDDFNDTYSKCAEYLGRQFIEYMDIASGRLSVDGYIDKYLSWEYSADEMRRDVANYFEAVKGFMDVCPQP